MRLVENYAIGIRCSNAQDVIIDGDTIQENFFGYAIWVVGGSATISDNTINGGLDQNYLFSLAWSFHAFARRLPTGQHTRLLITDSVTSR